MTSLKKEYDEALESLKHVHNQKDLEKSKQRVFKARDNLLASSEKFRREYEERHQEAAAISEMQKTEARSRAEGLREKYDPWMKNPYLRKINSELINNKTPKIGGLVCPQCGEVDHGNKNNKKSWCFKCNIQLIPEAMAKKFRSKIRMVYEVSDENKMKGWF